MNTVENLVNCSWAIFRQTANEFSKRYSSVAIFCQYFGMLLSLLRGCWSFFQESLSYVNVNCIKVSRSQWIPMIETTALEAWLVVAIVIHTMSLLLREVLSAGSQDAESWGWSWVRSWGRSQLFILTPRSLLCRAQLSQINTVHLCQNVPFPFLEKTGSTAAKLFSKCSKLFSFSLKRRFCKFSVIMAFICIYTKMLKCLHHLWSP